MKTISCIIPAYNEASRIRNVLGAVVGHPLLSEIIVVDDGSKDGTKDVVSSVGGVKLIAKEKNAGKSLALYTGIKESLGEYLMFIDSDLVGLTADNITALIEPIVSAQADVSISLRRNTPPPWRWIGLDYISGERVLPKQMMLQHLEEIPKLRRFGFEVFLNSIIISKKYRIKVVPWINVDSPYKYKKDGLWKGVKVDIKMLRDIFATVSFFGTIKQIIAMRRQRV